MERQRDIIYNYRNIIIFNKNAENKCKRFVDECKQEVEHKHTDRVFCELDKIDQKKIIDKLQVKRKNNFKYGKKLQNIHIEL